MRTGRRVRRWWALPLALMLLVPSACDGSTSQQAEDVTPSAGRVSTQDVLLPGVGEPVVVAAWGEDLLLGSRAPEGSASRPRLTLLTADGASREVAVAPVTPTAFEAKWLAAAPRGASVDLVAGAPAGAHSNTRWSTWRGDADSVRELPQPFETFGGWGAGALVALVQTPGSPVVVGSWEGDAAGLDIALWHPQGERWVRAASTGTALASTATELVAARGATAEGDGLLVVGSVTVLGQGTVTQRPAAWRAPTPDGPWSRTDLPGSGPLGEAHAAGCHGGVCTVVGQVDGELHGWVLAADGSVTGLALPALPVAAHDLLPAPLVGGAATTVLLASGGSLVVLSVGADAVEQWSGPPARAVRSAARTPAGDHVVLEDPAGVARLVRLERPGR